MIKLAMDQQKKICVVILEDHPSTMDGYVLRLSEAQDIQVVGKLFYGNELEPALEKAHPDVIILDIQVPTSPDNPNPYPIWHQVANLREKYPRLGILVISMYDRPALVDAAIESGVNGYILKDDSAAYRDLAAIVRIAASGGAFFSPSARQRWLKSRDTESETLFSPRQLEALSLCATYPDESLGDLARRMKVAESTTRNLLWRAYLKLGVNSRGAAVARARQLGLLSPHDY